MANVSDSSIKFFSKATSNQWLYVLSQYKEVFKIRAQATRGSKKSGPQEAIKLDNWYQEELPKLIQSRKDHRQLRHEELVQITKWKLWRTKNRAGLLDLVRMNTETAVKQVSTKAFKKCPTNLQSAISSLVNLKGIGVATASAILCAAFPEYCPFMADECLMCIPGIENTNYTIDEFIAFADQIKACCERLQAEDPTAKWTPHKVELTLWTHYWIKETKLNLLDNMPTPVGVEDIEDGSCDAKSSSNKNGGDSHVKISLNGVGSGGDEVLEDDSNISVPVSNTSEVEEKSYDSTKDDDEYDDDDISRSRMSMMKKNNGNSKYNNNNNNKNSTSTSAYNCIEDAKDGLGIVSCSDENSRQQIISNGEHSNLSYSNLSSEDLNTSTTENTTDNNTYDASNPTTITTTTTTSIPTNTNTNNNLITSSSSSSSTTTNNNVTLITQTSPSSTLLPPPPPLSVPLPPAPSTPSIRQESMLYPVSSTSPEVMKNNGHYGNGESCSDNGTCEIEEADIVELNNIKKVSEKCSLDTGNTDKDMNSIKRSVDEISTSEGERLDDNGPMDKKVRIE